MRRSRTDEGVLSHKALQALAVGAPAPVATLVLRNVLRDARAPRADRVTAARLLGTIGTKEARNVLGGSIRDRHPRVRQAVFASLGQIGEPTDLKKLGQLADSDDRHTARQLEFARALIAHRHGLVTASSSVRPVLHFEQDEPSGPCSSTVPSANQPTR